MLQTNEYSNVSSSPSVLETNLYSMEDHLHVLRPQSWTEEWGLLKLLPQTRRRLQTCCGCPQGSLLVWEKRGVNRKAKFSCCCMLLYDRASKVKQSNRIKKKEKGPRQIAAVKRRASCVLHEEPAHARCAAALALAGNLTGRRGSARSGI